VEALEGIGLGDDLGEFEALGDAQREARLARFKAVDEELFHERIASGFALAARVSLFRDE
jgi:hypothetical protein